MEIDPEDVLIAFHEGQVHRFRKSNKHECSWFGGPCEDYPVGIEHGPDPLQHVATLWWGHLPPLATAHITSVPLFFGFQFGEDCEIEYVFENGKPRVLLTRLDPNVSQPDQPYRFYPPLFPYYPIAPIGIEQTHGSEFQNVFRQPVVLKNSELIVLVPRSGNLGVSLWGNSDAQLIFRIHLRTKMVEAYYISD